MTLCLCHIIVKQTMSFLCGVQTMQTPMMPCHISHMWYEWNENPKDIMLMWFTLYVNPNDVTLGTHETCIHT